MSGDRVELQAVRQGAGLPDVLPVSMQPGVAGAHAKLAGGSIVLVEFIEGDRTLPFVASFAGKDTSGHGPDELDFTVSDTIRLGSDGATESYLLGNSWASDFGSFQTDFSSWVTSIGAWVAGGTTFFASFASEGPVGPFPTSQANAVSMAVLGATVVTTTATLIASFATLASKLVVGVLLSTKIKGE
jgi:hypothetical protein